MGFIGITRPVRLRELRCGNVGVNHRTFGVACVFCKYSQFKHLTECTLHRHRPLYYNIVPSLLLLLLFFPSSAYPQTDTDLLHNTQ